MERVDVGALTIAYERRGHGPALVLVHGGWEDHRTWRHAPAEAVDQVRTMMAESRAAGSAPMLLAMAEADLREVLPRVSIPTLLLYGEEDVRSPRTVAEEMHAAIPGSRLIFLPGVGHVANLEAPDRFNETVRTFLRSVEDARTVA